MQATYVSDYGKSNIAYSLKKDNAQSFLKNSPIQDRLISSNSRYEFDRITNAAIIQQQKWQMNMNEGQRANKIIYKI